MKLSAFFLLLFAGLSPDSFAEESVARFPGASPEMGTSLLIQLGMGLALVITLIYMLAWLSKKIQGTTKTKTESLKVIESVALGARERLVLVQVHDEQVLIGMAPGAVTRLHSVDSRKVASLQVKSRPPKMVSSIPRSKISIEDQEEFSPLLTAFLMKLNRQI